MEEWRDIPGYEGYYKVSNYGRVKSLDRYTPNKWGSVTFRKGIIMKQCWIGDKSSKYLGCKLSKDGKGRSMGVHKLVCMSFLDHVPCGMSIIVDHIDNNKMNNHLSNLQLTDVRGNASKDKVGTSKYVGVSWKERDQRWVTSIHINGGKKWLGQYKNEYDAHLAYQEALSKINPQ